MGQLILDLDRGKTKLPEELQDIMRQGFISSYFKFEEIKNLITRVPDDIKMEFNNEAIAKIFKA